MDGSPRQRAYLAARPVFSGVNAQIRRPKPIRELILNHRPTFAQLLGEMGEGGLVMQLQGLLRDRIFESDLQAKAEFPRLFDPYGGSQREAEREASEADAVRSTQDALEEIDSGDETERPAVEEDEVDNRAKDVKVDEPTVPRVDPESAGGEQQRGGTVVVNGAHPVMPSLYPCYLPYKTQHMLLNAVQGILEACCFDFAQRWLPDVLARRGWDCPAAVELTKWARILTRHAGSLPIGVVDLKGNASLKELITSTHQLRHTAVHRVPTTARGMSHMIRIALDLVEALRDHARAAQLDRLKSELDSKLRAMELNKNVLENSTTEKLGEIRRRREELDRLEAKLLEDMVEEDLRNKVLIGTLLEQSVDAICLSGSKGEDDVEEQEEHEDETINKTDEKNEQEQKHREEVRENDDDKTETNDDETDEDGHERGDSETDESDEEAVDDGIRSMTDAINAAVDVSSYEG